MKPIQFLLVGSTFFITWLLWSGIYTTLLNGLGLLSCAMVLWLAQRTGFFDSKVYSLHLCRRLPAYWWWLAGEIVKANLVVARIVLAREMKISPTVVTICASNLTPVGQAIVANAITLTPATVSFDLEEGCIQVHCLTAKSASELQSGEMLRRASLLVAE